MDYKIISKIMDFMHIHYSYIMSFKPLFVGIIWCPLKLKLLVRVLLVLLVRETLCDIYIICQESHCVCALDNSQISLTPNFLISNSKDVSVWLGDI